MCVDLKEGCPSPADARFVELVFDVFPRGNFISLTLGSFLVVKFNAEISQIFSNSIGLGEVHLSTSLIPRFDQLFDLSRFYQLLSWAI